MKGLGCFNQATGLITTWRRKEQIQTHLEFMVSQEASHSTVLLLTQIQTEVLPHSLYDWSLSPLPFVFVLLALLLLLALSFVFLLPLLAFALLGLALLAFDSLWGLCQLPVGQKPIQPYMTEKKKGKTTPFGVNLMRSRV